MKSKSFNYLDILIDNPNSWMWQYIQILEDTLSVFANGIRIFKNSNEVEYGDILFILSCDKILEAKTLGKHKNNIVIHESDLPIGKGWSPLSYQVESGANKIPITLFEADKTLDSGKWYLKDNIQLAGYELIDQIREKQAIKSFEMIEEYLSKYPMEGYAQRGEETFYKKRVPKDQELNLDKSLREQFNTLRVCDNNKYPATFSIYGRKYTLKIDMI